VKLIEVLGNDRDEDAAAFLHTSVSTFRRWKNASQMPDTETLMLIADKLGISLDWLLLGKGTAGLHGEISPPLAVRNKEGRYTGDLLNEALEILKLDTVRAARKTGIDAEEMYALLESKIKPDFDQLESLYLNLGINPVCFFGVMPYWCVVPRDQLLLALAAVGYIGREPTNALLEDVFSVPAEEAQSFLLEWQEARKHGRNHVLPEAWLDALSNNYEMEPGWLLNGNGPIAKRSTRQFSTASEAENNLLKNKLIAALEDNKRLHERIERIQGNMEVFISQAENAPTGPGAAPLLPQSNEVEILTSAEIVEHYAA
jgi:transcriptional regulator with XRE-family HTH domain